MTEIFMTDNIDTDSSSQEKHWYTDCTVTTDLLSGEEYADIPDIDQQRNWIKIYFIRPDMWHRPYIACFPSLPQLVGQIRGTTQMANWVPQNLEKGLTSEGIGGTPGYLRMVKIPGSYDQFILTPDVEHLPDDMLPVNALHNEYAAVYIGDMRIGNTGGHIIVSGAHGQLKHPIYEVVPKVDWDTNGRHILTEMLINMQLAYHRYREPGVPLALGIHMQILADALGRANPDMDKDAIGARIQNIMKQVNVKFPNNYMELIHQIFKNIPRSRILYYILQEISMTTNIITPDILENIRDIPDGVFSEKYVKMHNIVDYGDSIRDINNVVYTEAEIKEADDYMDSLNTHMYQIVAPIIERSATARAAIITKFQSVLYKYDNYLQTARFMPDIPDNSMEIYRGKIKAFTTHLQPRDIHLWITAPEYVNTYYLVHSHFMPDWMWSTGMHEDSAYYAATAAGNISKLISEIFKRRPTVYTSIICTQIAIINHRFEIFRQFFDDMLFNYMTEPVYDVHTYVQFMYCTAAGIDAQSKITDYILKIGSKSVEEINLLEVQPFVYPIMKNGNFKSDTLSHYRITKIDDPMLYRLFLLLQKSSSSASEIETITELYKKNGYYTHVALFSSPNDPSILVTPNVVMKEDFRQFKIDKLFHYYPILSLDYKYNDTTFSEYAISKDIALIPGIIMRLYEKSGSPVACQRIYDFMRNIQNIEKYAFHLDYFINKNTKNPSKDPAVNTTLPEEFNEPTWQDLKEGAANNYGYLRMIINNINTEPYPMTIRHQLYMVLQNSWVYNNQVDKLYALYSARDIWSPDNYYSDTSDDIRFAGNAASLYLMRLGYILNETENNTLSSSNYLLYCLWLVRNRNIKKFARYLEDIFDRWEYMENVDVSIHIIHDIIKKLYTKPVVTTEKLHEYILGKYPQTDVAPYWQNYLDTITRADTIEHVLDDLLQTYMDNPASLPIVPQIEMSPILQILSAATDDIHPVIQAFTEYMRNGNPITETMISMAAKNQKLTDAMFAALMAFPEKRVNIAKDIVFKLYQNAKITDEQADAILATWQSRCDKHKLCDVYHTGIIIRLISPALRYNIRTQNIDRIANIMARLREPFADDDGEISLLFDFIQYDGGNIIAYAALHGGDKADDIIDFFTDKYEMTITHEYLANTRDINQLARIFNYFIVDRQSDRVFEDLETDNPIEKWEARDYLYEQLVKHGRITSAPVSLDNVPYAIIDNASDLRASIRSDFRASIRSDTTDIFVASDISEE